jgi:glycine cleavage system H protein
MKPSATYEFPDDRYYDAANHQWAKLEATSGRVLVGIDSLGLEALGELAYISLQPTGEIVRRGESIGTLEAAKMTGDIFAPVSGALVARNEHVLRDPLLINADPYDEGWIVAIEPSDWEVELTELVHGPALPAWVEAEIERYRGQGWVD